MTKDQRITILETEVEKLLTRIRRLEMPVEYHWSKEQMECLIDSVEYHRRQCKLEQRRIERKIGSYDKFKNFFGCK